MRPAVPSTGQRRMWTAVHAAGAHERLRRRQLRAALGVNAMNAAQHTGHLTTIALAHVPTSKSFNCRRTSPSIFNSQAAGWYPSGKCTRIPSVPKKSADRSHLAVTLPRSGAQRRAAHQL